MADRTAAEAAKLLIMTGQPILHAKVLGPFGAEHTCLVSVNSDETESLRAGSVAIWDEIVICRHQCINTPDRNLQGNHGKAEYV